MTEPEVRVEVVETEEGLHSLESDWNRLLAQCVGPSIFSTWEWTIAWWKSYGRGGRLLVVAIWRDTELIGLAPLYRRTVRTFGGVRLAELRLLGDGSGDSDYLAVAARRGDEELVGRRLVEYLGARAGLWDLLRLSEIPADSPMLSVLRSLCAERRYYWCEEEVMCAEVHLPDHWEGYLKGLAPRMRTKVRSITRRLEHEFSVRVDACERLDELDARLESLFALHGQRWAMEGQTGVFAWPAKRDFYRQMARLFLARGWLRLYSLSVDNRYVAHEFCFEYGGRVYLLQEGLDPAWAGHQVGNVLRAYVFRECIERGVDYYDFLGGSSQHKKSWGAIEKRSVRVTVGTRKLKSSLYFGIGYAARSGKSMAKRIVPETVLHALRPGRRPGSGGQSRKAGVEQRMKRWFVRAAGAVGARTGMVALVNRAASSFCLTSDSRGAWRIRRRGGCYQILTYHRVNPTTSPFVIDAVSPEVFEAQIRELGRHWDVVGLDDIVEAVEAGRPIPPRSIAVTFDDGYADNYEYARPILREYGVRATFFVATAHVGTGRMLWFDEILDAFARTQRPWARLAFLPEAWPLRTEDQRVAAAFEVLRVLRTVGPLQLSEALAQLFVALDVERCVSDGGAMLSWSQIRELVQDGHVIGSHTVSHAVLSRLRSDEVRGEIVESKRVIEENVGQPVTLFAYPSGRSCDYGVELGRMLREAGYRAAVRNLAFSANTPCTDPFQLTRMRPWEKDVQSFRAKLCAYRFVERAAVEA